MRYCSLWFGTSTAAPNPAQASTPPSGSGEVPTSATTGAMAIKDAPGGSVLYLARFRSAGVQSDLNALLLYDRLVHTSGLSGTSTSAQTVNSSSVNRPDANAYNTQLWLEVYTTIGASAQTATISYTNQAGTAGQSATATIGGANLNSANAMAPANLASGDYGVQSVQTVTLGSSTGTAGNFGITILRPLATLSIPYAKEDRNDYMETGLAQIPASACLAYLAQFSSIASIGEIVTIEG